MFKKECQKKSSMANKGFSVLGRAFHVFQKRICRQEVTWNNSSSYFNTFRTIYFEILVSQCIAKQRSIGVAFRIFRYMAKWNLTEDNAYVFMAVNISKIIVF